MKLLSICLISFMSLILMSFLFFSFSLSFLLNDLVVFIEWEVVTLNSFSIVLVLLLDWMSTLFMSFVLFISSMVIYYSNDYMMGDKNIMRFIMLVLLFVMSMMLLIISPNLISILLGWDGLGLISYCLVIYFQNIKAYNAGMLTVLSNRIGDVGLLLAISWMLNYGGWNYIFIIELMNYDYDMMVIGGLIILSSMTKSAQIPFSSWLPSAMAAPTPVSALVHSSTLVTAGVYLLIRFNSLVCNLWMGEVLLVLSGLTMFMAGLGANFEFDLKKIIALSTLSQLGLMMSVLSMGYYKLAFFHLLTHALFKALLFMCAGAIIHNLNSFQDIRLMGGLVLQMPISSACLNLANLALCGMPFLAGFYSKDLIMEMVSLSYLNMFSFFLFFFSVGLTVCYSFRLVYYSMTGDFNIMVLHFLNDNSWGMLLGMIGLLFMVIFSGMVLMWFLFSTPIMICLPYYLKFLTLLVCVLGGIWGYIISCVYFYNNPFKGYFITWGLGSMWFMPFISTYNIIFYPLNLGGILIKGLDQGWMEYLGGQSLYLFLKNKSKLNQMIQNNILSMYLLIFILCIMILLFLSGLF